MPIVEITAAGGRQTHLEKWTGLIPAAGRGSRLGYCKPKALYPILGRPLIDWVLDALKCVCPHFVVVTSPDGKHDLERHLAQRSDISCTIVIQEHATGMGDAVLLSDHTVISPFVAIAWVDQITLTQRTVSACATLHESRPEAVLTLPTVMKDHPYVTIERDSRGRLMQVVQSREIATTATRGESDCGLFMFSRDRLFRTLREAKAQDQGLGATTGEFDLVKLLPLFEQGPGSVLTVRINDESESLGLNTPEEAAAIERLLEVRQSEDGK